MNIEQLDAINAHNESFDSEVLTEIQRYRERLRLKKTRLSIMGFFHDVKKVEDQLKFLNKTERSMRRLLGVYLWIQ